MNNTWKKFGFGCAVALCTAVPVFAGPGGHGPGPGGPHFHGNSGVLLAAEIVGLVRSVVAPIGLIAAPPVVAPPVVVGPAVVEPPMVVAPPMPRVVMPPPGPYYIETVRPGYGYPPPPPPIPRSAVPASRG